MSQDAREDVGQRIPNGDGGGRRRGVRSSAPPVASAAAPGRRIGSRPARRFLGGETGAHVRFNDPREPVH